MWSYHRRDNENYDIKAFQEEKNRGMTGDIGDWEPKAKKK